MAITDEQFAAWLARDNERVVLCEAEYYAGGAVHTRYFADHVYVSEPGDDPANQPYDDILAGIPTFQVGIGSSSIGEIEVWNESGVRDSWLLDAWDGRSVRLYLGSPSWPRADFRQILSGTLAGIEAPAQNRLVLRLRDKRELLAVPVQTSTYASGPLTGKPKPILLGFGFNIEPVPLDGIDTPITLTSLTCSGLTVTGTAPTPHGYAVGDWVYIDGAVGGPYNGDFVITATTSTTFSYELPPDTMGPLLSPATGTIVSSLAALTYQIHDGAIEAILEVRDNGVPVAFTATLSAGTFRLHAKPVGAVRCDAKGATVDGAYIYKGADLVRWLALRAGFPEGDIDDDSFTAFAATCPQSLGLYITDARNADACIDEIMATLGGQAPISRAGKLQLFRIDAPTGSAVAEFSADDIDNDRGGLVVRAVELPAWKLVLGYYRNWGVVNIASLAGSVTATRKTALSREYRNVLKSAPSVKTAHPLATDLGTVNTLFADASGVAATLSAADSEADRRRSALRGSTRLTYEAAFTVKAFGIQFGDEIRLTYPRFGFQDGATAIVVGIDEQLSNGRVVLTLWR
jgi:hypothetical protein